MTLKQWLKVNGLKVVEFSDLLGLEHSTIYRILRGERMPSLEVATVIEYYTGGEVTADTFLKVTPEQYLRRWRTDARKSTSEERRRRAIRVPVRRIDAYDPTRQEAEATA